MWHFGASKRMPSWLKIGLNTVKDPPYKETQSTRNMCQARSCQARLLLECQETGQQMCRWQRASLQRRRVNACKHKRHVNGAITTSISSEASMCKQHDPIIHAKHFFACTQSMRNGEKTWCTSDKEPKGAAVCHPMRYFIKINPEPANDEALSVSGPNVINKGPLPHWKGKCRAQERGGGCDRVPEQEVKVQQKLLALISADSAWSQRLDPALFKACKLWPRNKDSMFSARP